MIKKLFSVLLIAVASLTMNAQSIGIVGDFNGWGNDVVMATTDDVNYTAQVSFTSNGNCKFRQDGGWGVNWGAADFPCGTGVQNGTNIPYLAGIYDVTFNRTTGAYCFTVVQTNFDTLHIFGGFNGNVTPGEQMVTTNGTDYVKSDFHFTEPNVKFFRSAPTVTTWGGSAFPSGSASVDGPFIPVTPGFYSVDLNISTGLYNFVETPVSIIGTATEFNNFDDDIFMVSTDGGVTFSLQDVVLSSGLLKFRTNANWALNWGGSSFPSGTAQVGGGDLQVIAGTYNISFNRVTGAYNFECSANCADQVTFAGTNMITTDGVNYSLNNYIAAAGLGATGMQFINVTTSQIYGGTAFPSGTAVLNGGTIPVVPGFYNISFNKNTLAYSFTVTPVGLIGDGANGWGDDDDVMMNTTDNGITYTLTNQELFNGAVKFRSNTSWAYNWGGDGTLNGTAVVNGPDNINVTDGFYDISLNTHTGAYTFTNLSSERFDNNLFAIYPNPASDMFRIAGEFNQVQIFNISGQLVKTYTNNDALSVADLNAGIYMVKVTGEAGVSVKKLIKK
jgi:starch-binding outer membrane protein SusE/F